MSGKAQYDPLIEFVNERASIWAHRMGLGYYKIEHTFIDAYYHEDDGGDDFKITATTEVRWNYMQAKVKWYLPSATRHSTAHIEEVLVHELCHVLLAPEQQLIDVKLSERGASDEMTDSDRDTLTDLYYERLEMATESVARSLLLAWGPAKREDPDA